MRAQRRGDASHIVFNGISRKLCQQEISIHSRAPCRIGGRDHGEWHFAEGTHRRSRRRFVCTNTTKCNAPRKQHRSAKCVPATGRRGAFEARVLLASPMRLRQRLSAIRCVREWLRWLASIRVPLYSINSFWSNSSANWLSPRLSLAAVVFPHARG